MFVFKLTTIPFLFFYTVVFSQQEALRKQADSMVSVIDKIRNTSKFRWIRSSYEYKIQDGQIVKIVRHFQKSITNFEHTFYLKDSRLFFASEKEVSYYLRDDSIGWGGKYYFQNNKLISYETLGHGKSETEEWQPEAEVLAQFNKARKDVVNYQNRKRRSKKNTFH